MVSKREKKLQQEEMDKRFKKPIICVDLRAGVTGGQGIDTYWEEENVRGKIFSPDVEALPPITTGQHGRDLRRIRGMGHVVK